jgi:hypothetical protein
VGVTLAGKIVRDPLAFFADGPLLRHADLNLI